MRTERDYFCLPTLTHHDVQPPDPSKKLQPLRIGLGNQIRVTFQLMGERVPRRRIADERDLSDAPWRGCASYQPDPAGRFFRYYERPRSEKSARGLSDDRGAGNQDFQRQRSLRGLDDESRAGENHPQAVTLKRRLHP